MKKLFFAIILALPAFAEKSGNGPLGVNKPLEVRGQNRALQMMQVGKGEKTKIGFVQPRKNFRPQILSTHY